MDAEVKGAIQKPGTGVQYAGTHLFIDLWEADNCDRADIIEEAVMQAVRDCGANELESRYIQYGEDGGVTGFSILAESHICVNTWTENRMVAIDVFVCGGIDPYQTLPALIGAFNPGRVDISEHKRLLGTAETHGRLVD